MKVLYLDDPNADFGAALLYRGLCNVLGESNVIDFPDKPTWHSQESHTYRKGEVPFLPGHSGHTASFPWMKLTPTQGWTTPRVLDHARDFDLVVLSSNRAGVWNTWDHIRHRAPFPRGVVTDHEDHNVINIPSMSAHLLPILFKRELFSVPIVREGFKIYPLPFSCGWADLLPPGDPLEPNRLGVFLSCSMTHPIRAVAAAQAELFMERGIQGQAYGNRYATGLQTAKIGVSVRGHGVDTLRQWEIPFFGALLVTDSTLVHPDNFVHNEDCVRYSEHSKLANLLGELLTRDDLGQLAKKGQEKLLKYHTTTARANYFLQKVKEL